MMHRPWPRPALCDAAPVNRRPNPARMRLDIDRDPVEAFPTVADLAQIWLAIQDAKRRGEQP